MTENTLPCGTIRAICISKKKGMRKAPVEGPVVVKENWGIEEDAHAGDWHRQVSFLAWESIEKAQSWGLNVAEGDFAENITTEGLDLHTLPLGTKVQVGEEVKLELSQIGKACHTRCAIYYQAGDCIFPREGIFFVVLQGGTINVGDTIQVTEMGDGTCNRTPAEALAEVAEFHANECAKAAKIAEKLESF